MSSPAFWKPDKPLPVTSVMELGIEASPAVADARVCGEGIGDSGFWGFRSLGIPGIGDSGHWGFRVLGIQVIGDSGHWGFRVSPVLF